MNAAILWEDVGHMTSSYMDVTCFNQVLFETLRSPGSGQVKDWPTDLGDPIRSPLEVKSSQT